MEEKKLREYRRRIRQIDSLLIPSIKSLVDIASEDAPREDPLAKTFGDRKVVYFPPWVSDIATAPLKHYLVTRSFCAATLRRIWRVRRRFPELERNGTFDKLRETPKPEQEAQVPTGSKQKEKSLLSRLEETFVRRGSSFEQCAELLHSDTYGALNPMTASHVFSVLIETGERNTHGALGFLAFFCMVWSMKRQFPPGVAGDGAQLEPWGPSAYVTAKCLLPIQTLRRVCKRREELFREIREALEELKELQDCSDPHSHWRFASTLDGLSNTFLAVSRLSIAPDDMKQCGKKLSEWEDLGGRTDNLSNSELAFGSMARWYGKVEKAARKALQRLRDECQGAHDEARGILDNVDKKLISWLEAMKTVWEAVEILETLSREPKSLRKCIHQLVRVPHGNAKRHEREVEPEELDADAEQMCQRIGELVTVLSQADGAGNAMQDPDAQAGAMNEVHETTAQLLNLLGEIPRDARLTEEGWGAAAESIRNRASDLRKEATRKFRPLSIGIREDTCLKPPDEWRTSGEYWKDLHNAAVKALELCSAANELLAEVANLGEIAEGRVGEALETVEGANEAMAEFFGEKFDRNAAWCRMVAEREVAHISAKNHTGFSPSELVSATSVAVRWRKTRSPLAVADAIEKAVTGARDDGSWLPGQPYYCEGRLLTVVPVTSDTVNTLGTAITDYWDIKEADRAFERYVDWLDRKRCKLPGLLTNGAEKKEVCGWASDRAPGPRRVDLWATAHSINALLEIRDVVEHRLWQMCERNFTVLEPRRRFSDLDPLDLDKPHEKRLLCQLKREAPRVQGGGFKTARYSFVLHGPPGSSKSSVAEALAADVWRSPVTQWEMKPQVVRITPADFTRLGESRLDSVARFIFELLESVRGVTVFFDEIDDLLRKRGQTSRTEFLQLVVPAMLNRLQDLREACERQQICVVLATNYIERIEPALLRKGRIDSCLPVVYPDRRSREAMAWKALLERDGEPNDKPQPRKVFAQRVAARTRGLPWKDVDGECRKRCPEFTDKPARTNRELKGASPPQDGSVPEPGYGKRCAPGPVSLELRNEVCAYFKVQAADPKKCWKECRELALDLPCPDKKNRRRALRWSLTRRLLGRRTPGAPKPTD